MPSSGSSSCPSRRPTSSWCSSSVVSPGSCSPSGCAGSAPTPGSGPRAAALYLLAFPILQSSTFRLPMPLFPALGAVAQLRLPAVERSNYATVYNLTENEVYSFIIKARDVTGNYSPASNQVTTGAVAGGLNYKYFESATAWTTLPNFSTLTPVKTGNTPNIDLTVRNRTTNYGMYWEGQIYIPVAGSYTFETYSDDGSKLYIGSYSESNLVVNNDGVHGAQYREGTKTFATPGMYPIVITYFQGSSSTTMQVYWKNTPIGVTSRQQIPNWAFQQKFNMPGTPPTPPRNVAVTAVAYNQVNITWTDQSNNEEGFQIFRATTNTGPYIPVGEVDAGITSFADKSVQPNTTYYYRVEALGQYG